jgi:hypothetical protein
VKLQLRDRWTPRQALRVLECLHALYEAVSDAYDEEIHFYLEDQRRRRKRPTRPCRPPPAVDGELARELRDDDIPF